MVGFVFNHLYFIDWMPMEWYSIGIESLFTTLNVAFLISICMASPDLMLYIPVSNLKNNGTFPWLDLFSITYTSLIGGLWNVIPLELNHYLPHWMFLFLNPFVWLALTLCTSQLVIKKIMVHFFLGFVFSHLYFIDWMPM